MSQKFQIKGDLHAIFETKQVSEKFSKREFVVAVKDGKYEQFILFQTTGDRCSQLDDFRVGDEVEVNFNLRGREWRSPNGEIRYFTTLDMWRTERTSAGSSSSRNRGGSHESPPPRDDGSGYMPSRPGDVDDIPF